MAKNRGGTSVYSGRENGTPSNQASELNEALAAEKISMLEEDSAKEKPTKDTKLPLPPKQSAISEVESEEPTESKKPTKKTNHPRRTEEGKLLGYIVTSEGIRANLEKTKVMINMPSPSNLKQMQSLSEAADEAFQTMKRLVAELSTLATRMKDEELMVYLFDADEAVNAVLLVERNEK
ncbi:hypothetical protein Tco_0825647 [Tanacetum coccineum]